MVFFAIVFAVEGIGQARVGIILQPLSYFLKTSGWTPLQVTADGYHRAGTLLARLGLPTVAVQEGGYHLPTLGPLVVAALAGLHGTTD